MSKFKYLVFSVVGVWGKQEITKEYFINAVARDDLLVNLEDNTYYDKSENAWVPIEGDE